MLVGNVMHSGFSVQYFRLKKPFNRLSGAASEPFHQLASLLFKDSTTLQNFSSIRGCFKPVQLPFAIEFPLFKTSVQCTKNKEAGSSILAN